MYGEGHRRNCSECGRPYDASCSDSLSRRELRGPRNITSANVDRIFDNGGQRFLIIEEKHDNEREMKAGQENLLLALARLPMFDVWLARGTPDRLNIYDFGSDEPWPFLQDGTFEHYQGAVAQWFERKRGAA